MVDDVYLFDHRHFYLQLLRKLQNLYLNLLLLQNLKNLTEINFPGVAELLQDPVDQLRVLWSVHIEV